MEYTIEEVYVQGDNLIVVVDHAFGKKKYGFSKESLKLDPETDKPRYIKKVEYFLEKEFGDKNRRKKHVKDDYVGKKFKHKGINIGNAK